jgi:hypothetical protein
MTSSRSDGRLLGVGSVDPQLFTGRGAADEAERCLKELKLAGVNVDPAFLREPISRDDATLFPVYEVCADIGAPVFMMSGPTTPDLRRNDPLAVDRIARAFPTLPIICCHAFYPRIDEMIGIAFRNENVFVSPDMYLFAPGGRRYADAASGCPQARISWIDRIAPKAMLANRLLHGAPRLIGRPKELERGDHQMMKREKMGERAVDRRHSPNNGEYLDPIRAAAAEFVRNGEGQQAAVANEIALVLGRAALLITLCGVRGERGEQAFERESGRAGLVDVEVGHLRSAPHAAAEGAASGLAATLPKGPVIFLPGNVPHASTPSLGNMSSAKR